MEVIRNVIETLHNRSDDIAEQVRYCRDRQEGSGGNLQNFSTHLFKLTVVLITPSSESAEEKVPFILVYIEISKSATFSSDFAISTEK